MIYEILTIGNKKALHKISFANLDDLQTTVLDIDKIPDGNKCSSPKNAITSLDNDFYCLPWLDAVEYLTTGWHDGGVTLKAAVACHTDTAPAPRRVLSVAGGSPVVPLALAGVPSCMARRQKTIATGSARNIYISPSVEWRKTPAQMIEALSAVLNQIDTTTDTIHLCYTGTDRHSKNAHIFTCPISTPGRRLNYGVVAYCCGHPAFFRRVIFRLLGLKKTHNDRDSYVFGRLTACEIVKKHVTNSNGAANYFVSLNDVISGEFSLERCKL